MFSEDVESRIRNLEKAIVTNPPHREYLEGQLSAYRYVIAMMAEIEEGQRDDAEIRDFEKLAEELRI